MKVVIFGAKGYLGQQFLSIYPDAVTPTTDITKSDEVGAVLESEKPNVVINAAGRTGLPNADWCEEHKVETLSSNVTGALVLMHECMARNIYMVQLGSGCIYEGDSGGMGFTEEDAPNFFGSFYGRTKLWTDQILKEFPVLTLRLRMPFDDTTSAKSLIQKIKNYKRLLDTQNSLTYMPEFLAAADTLIRRRNTGLFNVVNPGTISPYEIMQIYRDIVDPSLEFEPMHASQILEVARVGRSNCVLSIDKLSREGIKMTPIRQAMAKAMQALAARQPVSAIA